MRIGIIGPSDMRFFKEVNSSFEEIFSKMAEIVAKSGNEIVATPDKGAATEFFAKEYSKSGGKKVYEIVLLDDKEFGYDWVNTDLGENINCGTWRNQPEKFNEEADLLICVGYAVGVLPEIAYAKWFKPKRIYIIMELISSKLPKEINDRLNIEYVSYLDLKEKLENVG